MPACSAPFCLLLRELVRAQREHENHGNQREQRKLNLAGKRPAPAGDERAHHISAERSTRVDARDEHARASTGEAAAERLDVTAGEVGVDDRGAEDTD